MLCEFTHFDPVQSQAVFQQIRPGKLVFHHVARKNEAIFPEFSKTLAYPAAVARDGDEIEI